MSLVYHWRREKLITLKAHNSSFLPSFIIIKFSVIGQLSPIFYSCFLTLWENMPVYSVDCCSMSHTWRRQRIKKDVQANTHIQPLKAPLNIGDRRKSNKLCANIKETLTEGMILISMFYLEGMHRPNWVFQITAIVMILVELMFSIKYWKTNNENYSCKIYIEEVSANISVESGKKTLVVDLQVVLPSGLCGGEGKIHPRILSVFYRLITCCPLVYWVQVVYASGLLKVKNLGMYVLMRHEFLQNFTPTMKILQYKTDILWQVHCETTG